MTICIAAICSGGSNVILASDSMIINEWLSIQFEHQTKKMALLSDCCIALTAGDALAHTELFNVVQGEINKLKSPMVSEVVEKIKTCYQSIREREINERILNPRGFRDFSEFYKAQRVMIPETILPIQAEIERYDYQLEILIGGMSGNTASIYGIYNPGTSKCFDAIGFHAIGSGGPHALNTLIARGCHQETASWEGTLIVYEAKKMAEKAPGVGARITNMSIMNSKGFFEIPKEKFVTLHQIYDNWVRKDPNCSAEVEKLLHEIGALR